MMFRNSSKPFNHDLPPIKFGNIGGKNPDEFAEKFNRAKRQRWAWWYKLNISNFLLDHSAVIVAGIILLGFFGLIYVAVDNNWIDENTFSTPCRSGHRIHGFQNGGYVDLCVE